MMKEMNGLNEAIKSLIDNCEEEDVVSYADAFGKPLKPSPSDQIKNIFKTCFRKIRMCVEKLRRK